MASSGASNDINRNSTSSFTVCLNDIGKDLETLRGSRAAMKRRAERVRQERDDLAQRMDAMQRRRQALDKELDELDAKQRQIDETIAKAEETYLKLLESSQTLSAFVKKESEAAATACAQKGNADGDRPQMNGGY